MNDADIASKILDRQGLRAWLQSKYDINQDQVVGQVRRSEYCPFTCYLKEVTGLWTVGTSTACVLYITEEGHKGVIASPDWLASFVDRVDDLQIKDITVRQALAILNSLED